ncbi:hypothetical protein GRX31_13950 [Delftia sp. CH05]|nr:hypothetical protein [Delftia sp. CH05]
MKLRPNAEIYGKAVTRITADISVPLQKAGYSAEELTEYNFVRLTEGSTSPEWLQAETRLSKPLSYILCISSAP